MTIPTQGESYAKLIHHLREAQDASAMLAHLANANDDRLIAKGWLAVQEMLKKTVINVTKLAMGKMQ